MFRVTSSERKQRFPLAAYNPISFPESFCVRLKKRKTGKTVEKRIFFGFYENNKNDRKSFRTTQNGGESYPRGTAVCRCCNCNIVEANHPIYLYGKKASNESLLNFLEKLNGYKCDLADELPTKICRLWHDKITKFKKFIEIVEKSSYR